MMDTIDDLKREVKMSNNFIYKIYDLLEKINKNLEVIKDDIHAGRNNSLHSKE
jgi:hypothetical protein